MKRNLWDKSRAMILSVLTARAAVGVTGPGFELIVIGVQVRRCKAWTCTV